jgi:hypothetical protein
MESIAPRTEPGPKGASRRTVAVTVATAIGLLALGFASGVSWSSRHNADTWYSGLAHTGSRQISVDHEGWTYGASDSVPAWIDRRGTLHEAGWPDCLRGPGRQVTVRFQAREVKVDGTTWRPVVAIDCSA